MQEFMSVHGTQRVPTHLGIIVTTMQAQLPKGAGQNIQSSRSLTEPSHSKFKKY